MSIQVSVVIRTYNEEKHLEELLSSITNQYSEIFEIETVIVDSGSTDRTLSIAGKYNCRITHILKADFTFGRSLNVGCAFAKGEYLVFISGHCIPTSNLWLHNLVSPLADNLGAYSYGRQTGRDTTKFSEQQLLKKYFPTESKIPQVGFFCNNANSALKKTTWEKYKFNEDLTGLEDMYLAKEIINDKQKITYVSDACVFHIHDEKWIQVKKRYERESIALQKIMPEIHFGPIDFLKYFISAVTNDTKEALRERKFLVEIKSILSFRLAQYMGVYTGNHIHRKLSNRMKIEYYYPTRTDKDITNDK